MSDPITLTEIKQLPVIAVSDLTQLQWAFENWQIEYGRAACNTSEAYRLFDAALELGLTADERRVWETTLTIVETSEAFARKQLDEAKTLLLAVQS
jgi:hypothetical protein